MFAELRESFVQIHNATKMQIRCAERCAGITFQNVQRLEKAKSLKLIVSSIPAAYSQ